MNHVSRENGGMRYIPHSHTTLYSDSRYDFYGGHALTSFGFPGLEQGDGYLLPTINPIIRFLAFPLSFFRGRRAKLDIQTAVSHKLTPGEATLFDTGIVHGSEANYSQSPRYGLILRMRPKKLPLSVFARPFSWLAWQLYILLYILEVVKIKVVEGFRKDKAA